LLSRGNELCQLFSFPRANCTLIRCSSSFEKLKSVILFSLIKGASEMGALFSFIKNNRKREID